MLFYLLNSGLGVNIPPCVLHSISTVDLSLTVKEFVIWKVKTSNEYHKWDCVPWKNAVEASLGETNYLEDLGIRFSSGMFKFAQIS